MGLTVDSSQLTFLLSSNSRDTQTRTSIKNPARPNLRWFQNQWSVASSNCKWIRR